MEGSFRGSGDPSQSHSGLPGRNRGGQSEQEQSRRQHHAQAGVSGSNPRSFSSFIYDSPLDTNLPHETTPIQTDYGTATGEIDDLMLDDIFGDMDPQSVYREDDTEFLSFLEYHPDTSNILPKP